MDNITLYFDSEENTASFEKFTNQFQSFLPLKIVECLIVIPIAMLVTSFCLYANFKGRRPMSLRRRCITSILISNMISMSLLMAAGVTAVRPLDNYCWYKALDQGVLTLATINATLALLISVDQLVSIVQPLKHRARATERHTRVLLTIACLLPVPVTSLWLVCLRDHGRVNGASALCLLCDREYYKLRVFSAVALLAMCSAAITVLHVISHALVYKNTKFSVTLRAACDEAKVKAILKATRHSLRTEALVDLMFIFGWSTWFVLVGFHLNTDYLLVLINFGSQYDTQLHFSIAYLVRAAYLLLLPVAIGRMVPEIKASVKHILRIDDGEARTVSSSTHI